MTGAASSSGASDTASLARAAKFVLPPGGDLDRRAATWARACNGTVYVDAGARWNEGKRPDQRIDLAARGDAHAERRDEVRATPIDRLGLGRRLRSGHRQWRAERHRQCQ